MKEFPLHLTQKQQQTLRYLAALGVVGVVLLLLARQSPTDTGYSLAPPSTGRLEEGANGSAVPPASRGPTDAGSSGLPASGSAWRVGSSGLSAMGLDESTRELEKRLAALLTQVQGAGRVEVMISLADGGQAEYVGNQRRDLSQTEEKDSQGVTRRSLQDQFTQEPLTIREGQNETLWLSRLVRPQIAGVMVVAEGAGTETVRLRLAEAVATALGVPAYRVVVLARRLGG